MDHLYENILSPVGAVIVPTPESGAAKRPGAGRTVVGLIDNSKPNVGLFLETLAEELRRSGPYDVVNVRKPRSAAPTPQLDALAAQCDVVINAIAD
jgi:hypothetical protein